MAYECPKCGGLLQRASGGGRSGGLVGMLLVAAFGSFQCAKCGKIPKSELPDEVRGKMRINSIIMVIVALALLVGVIAFLVAVQ